MRQLLAPVQIAVTAALWAIVWAIVDSAAVAQIKKRPLGSTSAKRPVTKGRASVMADRNNKLDRVQEATEQLIRMFESGNMPATVAKLQSIRIADKVPSARWSLGNRMLMQAAGTVDARGYKQWAEAGRHVIKGRHAIYILAPKIVRRSRVIRREVI